MGDVIALDSALESRADHRYGIIARHMGTDALARDLGTPSDWLDAAMRHLKVATSGRHEGAVSVSVAALHLVLMRLDEIEHGGEPWGGGA